MFSGGEDLQTKGSRYAGNGVFHGNKQHKTPKTSAHHLQEGHELITREIKSQTYKLAYKLPELPTIHAKNSLENLSLGISQGS